MNHLLIIDKIYNKYNENFYKMRLFLILLAAGHGKRLKTRIPKQFREVNNKTLLEYSLNKFKKFPQIKNILLVYNKNHKKYLNKLKLKNVIKITGGNTRQESTFKALKRINGMNCTKVIIHDAARPNPPKKLIKNLITKLKKNDAVIPVINTNDATKRVKDNFVFKNITRESLKFSQTPQGFTYNKIYQKHKEYVNFAFDDDSALFTANDEKVLTINGSKKNLKITDVEDLNIFNSMISGKTFYGIGFDIHKLISGRKLFLGGVKIPFKLGLEGHSDGDPVLHALIDSLLGACRLGDIGKIFSNKNKKYKNIRSTLLLEKTIKLINSKNFLINNIDINIIAQQPKIKDYSKKIINTISKLCKINISQINIKGKTTEKMGLIGKGKAIAAEVITSVTGYE